MVFALVKSFSSEWATWKRSSTPRVKLLSLINHNKNHENDNENNYENNNENYNNTTEQQ